MNTINKFLLFQAIIYLIAGVTGVFFPSLFTGELLPISFVPAFKTTVEDGSFRL
eukprot:Pgem_evm1s10449